MADTGGVHFIQMERRQNRTSWLIDLSQIRRKEEAHFRLQKKEYRVNVV